jgi:glutamate racemase
MSPPFVRPIGIFDSGVGGLTVFKALEAALPRESFVYLGDTARVPYGTRSAETVVRYSLEAARFLSAHDVKMLIVGCNTASSVALDVLARHLDVPVIGVIEPGAKRAAELSPGGRIGVIGTRATVSAEAYPPAIRALRPDAEVISRACPLFVPLAEEGWVDHDATRRIAEEYLAPMREAGIDTLVLGCTHYPLLKPTLAAVMGNDVRLVDSGEAVAAEVRARIQEDPALATPDDSAAVEHHFFVTDAPEPFEAVAERFLGAPVHRLERATIAAE